MTDPQHLPADIWCYIWFKLPPADQIRFRAASKSWMSILPSRQPPWLLLAEYKNEEPPFISKVEDKEEPCLLTPPPPLPSRGPVSLEEQIIYEIDFPEIHQARCIGSQGNWLITAHKDKTMRLLNPFSRHQIYLPSQLAFEHSIRGNGNHLFQIIVWKQIQLHLRKVILSSSPSNRQECIAMAIQKWQGTTLAIARLGDDKWTTVRIADTPISISPSVEDIVFYKGQFYAINNIGMLMVCDIGDGVNPPKASYLTGVFKEQTPYRINYLVEWLGELLLVIKWIEELQTPLRYRTSKFEVYKFDFINKEWNELKSLGEHSIFLGFNTSVSVCGSDYFGSVKKNCIYFTDDFVGSYVLGYKRGGYEMGVFELEDNSIRPCFSGVSTSLYSPPVWMVPS